MKPVLQVVTKKSSWKGSLTVEAAIVLPIFIVAIFTMMMIMKIVIVQEMVQYALTETAEDIAAYGYLYDQSGVLDLQKSLDGHFDENSDELEQIPEGSNLLKEQLGGITEYEAIATKNYPPSTSLWDQVIQLKGDIIASFDDFMSYYESIAGFLESLSENNILDSVLKDGYAYTTKVMNGFVISNLYEDYLSDEKLHRYGIVEGLKGLDFAQSKLFYTEDGTDDLILLAVQYKISLPSVFGVLDNIQMTNTVKTRAWTGSGKLEYARGHQSDDELSDDTIVYLKGENGTKYHPADCGSINIKTELVTLAEAKRRGYTQCMSKTDKIVTNEMEMVVITEGGSCYHHPSCKIINFTVTPITVKEAKEKGYTECNCINKGDDDE